jgi:tetratricopeptide (TPR) repeat protein
MQRLILIPIVQLIALHAAVPARADADPARYQRCVLQVKANAQAALEAARSWESEGGSTPAAHCAALAFLAMGHAADAAARLRDLADNDRTIGKELRADLYDEAGNAWLVAEQPDRAISALSSAIKLTSEVNLPARTAATYYSDRARALTLVGDNVGARRDLNHSIALAPTAAALTLRARIKRESKDLAGAANDIARALSLDGSFAEAYLERGRLEVGHGQRNAARQDFLKAAMAQEGPIREEAQREMQALDMKIGG